MSSLMMSMSRHLFIISWHHTWENQNLAWYLFFCRGQVFLCLFTFGILSLPLGQKLLHIPTLLVWYQFSLWYADFYLHFIQTRSSIMSLFFWHICLPSTLVNTYCVYAVSPLFVVLSSFCFKCFGQFHQSAFSTIDCFQ